MKSDQLNSIRYKLIKSLPIIMSWVETSDVMTLLWDPHCLLLLLLLLLFTTTSSLGPPLPLISSNLLRRVVSHLYQLSSRYKALIQLGFMKFTPFPFAFFTLAPNKSIFSVTNVLTLLAKYNFSYVPPFVRILSIRSADSPESFTRTKKQ